MARCAFVFRVALILCIPAMLRGQVYTAIHSFSNESGTPYAGLTQAPDGTFYGTTVGDGTWGQGSVFALTPDGNDGFSLRTLYSFTAGEDGANPRGSLLLASDGNLYGTTYDGVVARSGTAFRADFAGNLTTLYQFPSYAGGANPSTGLIQADDGNLYGVTESGGSTAYGTIFRLGLSGDVTIVHSFTGGDAGAFPRGGLLQGPDGMLYGTTFSGGALGGEGTVFRMSLSGTFETIHNFTGQDGANPYAGLVLGPDGYFYGTTQYGIGVNAGTIFRMDSTGNVTSYPFLAGSGANPVAPLVVGADGNLYGTTPTTLFRFTTGGVLAAIHTFAGPDGSGALAPLLQAQDGKLYGTTAQGALGFGSIFRISLSGDNFLSLYGFPGSAARGPAYALLQGTDNNLYGTASGGPNNLGVIFRVEPSGNATVVHTFSGSDGSYPSGLVRTPDGNLFGTAGGGDQDLGEIFQIDSSESFSLLHSLTPDEGSGPLGLTLASDGTLFGATTNSSPPLSTGTLFHADSLGGFSTLHTFAQDEGREVFGDFVEVGDGSLLGVAYAGGANDLGSVFRFDEKGGFTLLHSFSGWDGAHPAGRLIQAPDGKFYGLTQSGGSGASGALYRVDSSGHVTVLHSFSGLDGLLPTNSLAVGLDGNLYGVTRNGGENQLGNVFRSDSSGNVVTLHTFAGEDGSRPQSQILQGTDGGLYGATSEGGLFHGGVIFHLSLPPAVSVWNVSPSSGPSSGGTSVTVTGFNFSVGPTVLFGGIPATAIAVQNASILSATTPALPPGTLNDIVVTNFDSISGVLVAAWLSDFLDVPANDIFHPAVESVFRNGVSAGCGGGNYCRNDAVSRAQMATLLLKSEHGQGYVPPACAGLFDDVPCPGTYTDWIEQLSSEGITSGCGGGNYCPATPVTRAQLAVFLLKTLLGSSYGPPTVPQVFEDVPPAAFAADWIDDLYARGITGGCTASPLLYCPNASSTRGQMAALLVNTFQFQ